MLLLVYCEYILSVAVLAMFASIMTYPLCMPHDLATANRHDHAWTENWAPNIWMLCTALSPMRPRYQHRQGGRKNHLYGTEGTWINYPTCFPLLNVGVMAILRRTDCFILIWTCIAVLADHRQRSFSKLSWLQNKTHKKERSFCFAPMNMCLKRCLLSCMVGLTRLTTPRGWSAIRNTDPVGVKGWKLQGPSRGMVSKGSMSKAVLILQVLGPQG